MSLGRSVFHCWKEHGHGRIAMVQALGQSCDVYFYDLARRVGIDAIAAMANRFGLGHKLGIDLPGEQPGLIPTTDWKKATLGESWQKGETLVCGIGQGFVSATPLQLAIMAARLGNGGLAVTPWLVTPPAERARHRSACRQAPWTSCSRGMREVVHGARGTARAADPGLPGVEMARQDRHLAGAPHLARRARRRAPQAQGHPLGRARSRAVRLLRPAGEPALRRGGGGRARHERLQGRLADRARHHAQGAGARSRPPAPRAVAGAS